MKTLDLFSGCGGLSFGVSLAGGGSAFHINAGLDFHQASLDTFAVNHPDSIPICSDIRTASISDVAKLTGKPDLIVGGPSCQGFSTHGKRLADDPRNFLYKHFMGFVEELRPKWVLMENVTGLLRYGNGIFRENIVEDFQRMGYVVSFAQLQAADYGVAQTRKRVFFVANRLGIPFYFPRPTHYDPSRRADYLFKNEIGGGLAQEPYRTVEDALGDLPWIGRGVTESEAPTHYASAPSSFLQRYSRSANAALSMHYGAEVPEDNYERICNIPRGGDWLDIPQALLPPRLKRVLSKDATTLYYRLRWNRPAYTITTVYRNVSSGAFTHPDEDRALTHREAARIQSFPDHFKFVETNIGRQIGNAVPPLLAKAIAEAIARHMDVYSTIGLRSLSRFKKEVLAREVADREASLLMDQLRVNGTKNELGTLIRPLSAKTIKKVTALLAKANATMHSQMPLEVVLPLVRARLVEMTEHPLVAGISASSITRIMDYWERCGLLDHIAKEILGTQNSEDVHGGPNMDIEGSAPRRRRASKPNAHHFATVIYDVSADTRCTTMKPILVSTDG